MKLGVLGAVGRKREWETANRLVVSLKNIPNILIILDNSNKFGGWEWGGGVGVD